MARAFVYVSPVGAFSLHVTHLTEQPPIAHKGVPGECRYPRWFQQVRLHPHARS